MTTLRPILTGQTMTTRKAILRAFGVPPLIMGQPGWVDEKYARLWMLWKMQWLSREEFIQMVWALDDDA